MSKMLTLVLDDLYCHRTTGENSGHDEVYFKIWIDGNYWGTYPKNADESNTFDMNANDDNKKKVSLNLYLEYGDYVQIELREQDKASKPDKDEILGKITIYTSDIAYGDTSTHTSEFTGEGAWYDLHWRILSQKIPSLRILGIYCQQSSTNCNADTIDKVAGYASNCSDAASNVIGEMKTPKAEIISEAFAAAAQIILAVANFAEWIANAIEGDDDVYLQETWKGQQSTDGAGFCPGNGETIKLNDDEEYEFLPKYGHYFRFPLDQGEVTIELRERDKAKHDISLGAFTVNMNTYNAMKDDGATVQLLTKYNDNKEGQGSIYYVCYSLANEDWSKQANQDAQE